MNIASRIRLSIVWINLALPVLVGVIVREFWVAMFNPHLTLSLAGRAVFSIKPVILAASIIFSCILIVIIFLVLKPLFLYLKEKEQEEKARKVVLIIPWLLTIFHVVIWIIAVLAMYALVFKWNSPGGTSFITSFANAVVTGFLTGVLSALAMNIVLIPAKQALSITDIRQGEIDRFCKWKYYLIMITIGLNMAVFSHYMISFYYQIDKNQGGYLSPSAGAFSLYSWYLLLFLAMMFLARREDDGQVKRMQSRLDDLNVSGGDLSARILLLNFDNLGHISHSINKFLVTLGGLIKEISLAGKALGDTGEALIDKVKEADHTLDGSSSAVKAMTENFSKQQELINQSSHSIERIAKELLTLDDKISEQASIIEQSSAAIEEMIGNFSSATTNLKRTHGLFEELLQYSDQGKDKMKGVITRINQVKEESRKLEEANSLIAGIAAQTNLLAMNAAIEAAHAGDAGRGFAVVADEIRKLAENSSLRSKEVTLTLKATEEQINQVGEEIYQTGESFDQLRDKLNETDHLQEQLLQSMTEQEVGGREVLAGLTQMQDQMHRVQQTDAAVKEGSSDINERMEQLMSFSKDLLTMMDQVSTTNDNVQQVLRGIQHLTIENERNIMLIDREIRNFKY